MQVHQVPGDSENNEKNEMKGGGPVERGPRLQLLEGLSGSPRPAEIRKFKPMIGGPAQYPMYHFYQGPGDSSQPQTLVTGNGLPIKNVGVSLVFWGSEWTQQNPPPPVDPNALINAVQSIIASGYLEAAGQYGYQSATYDVAYFDTTNPPASFNRGTVQNEIVNLIAQQNLPHPNTGNYYDKFYCVMMPSTTVYGPGGLNGEHSAATWTDPSNNQVYRPYVAWVGNGSLDQMTATFSQELVEAISDPDGNETQISPANPNNWNEIGDICASVAYLDGVAVQAYWSQTDSLCTIPFYENTDSLFQYPPAGAELQVLAIQRFFSQESGKYYIGLIRALDGNTGNIYDLYDNQAVRLIDNGTNSFYVFGADGTRSTVITSSVNTDHEYLTTSPDDSTEDNLLSLPGIKMISNY